MSICKDPIPDHLKNYGYCTLYPPRASAMPLDLLLRKKKVLHDWGNLQIFQSSLPLPHTQKDITATTFVGTLKSSYTFSVGLTVLGSLIKVAGGKDLGLKAIYEKANILEFQYKGIQAWFVSPTEIDRYLNSSKLEDGYDSSRKYLKDDNLYILSRVVKANKIVVTAKRGDKTNIELDVPVIQEAVGGEIKVSVDTEQTSEITYEAIAPLCFGFQALQIDYDDDNGKFVYMLKPVIAGDVMALGAVEGQEPEYVTLKPSESIVSFE